MNFLVTAGPTHEPVDPVRFLGNRSSGKMGYAIASAALKRGHHVLLVSGPVTINPPPAAKVVRVETAAEMFDAVHENLDGVDVVVCCAAVADYTPAAPGTRKIKKSETRTLTLELVPTRDILLSLGEKKSREWKLAGFAAETSELEKNALEKLRKKNCDIIVANLVSSENKAFGEDENEVSVYFRDGRSETLPKASKRSIADRLVRVLERL